METFFIEYMFTLHARDEMMEFYNTKQKASDIFLYRRLQLKRRLPTLPQTQYHRRDKA